MKHSLRFNTPPKWNQYQNCNFQFYGLVEMCYNLYGYFSHGVNVNPKGRVFLKKPLKMLEIGSFKGESASIFASMQIFDSITCIEPFNGDGEGILKEFDDDWKNVKREFWTNTRHWEHIKLIQGYSYDIVPSFSNNEFHFAYIDGAHKYEDVLKDINMVLPKCSHAIGGHDYGSEFEGVTQAVNKVFKNPDAVFRDGSWIKYL